jgi:hypothetical protein
MSSKIKRKVLAADHPDTLFSMTAFDFSYGIQVHWKEAEELLTRAVEVDKRVLGVEHPEPLWSMRHLGRAIKLKADGRWAKSCGRE